AQRDEMHRPIRFLTTAIVLCHLLLSARVVTSQLRPPAPAPPPAPFLSPACLAALPLLAEPQSGEQSGVTRQSIAGPTEDVAIIADDLEKDGEVYRLRGNVQINYRAFQLNADEVTLNRATGDTTANGHVRLEGGPHDEHIRADSAQYNLQD